MRIDLPFNLQQANVVQSAEEAKQLGVVDEVLESRKKPTQDQNKQD